MLITGSCFAQGVGGRETLQRSRLIKGAKTWLLQSISRSNLPKRPSRHLTAAFGNVTRNGIGKL